MAKNILVWQPEYDFEILSIVSPVADYRLCWHLNETLQCDFAFHGYLKISSVNKQKHLVFPYYHYYDDMDKIDYFLIANKANGNLLLNELKNVDYVLKLQGYYATELKNDVYRELKNIPVIEAVFDIPLRELKNKTNLLF